MIEGLKPYPEYKDSGQKWLGGVPAHWDLKQGHVAFAPRKESNRGMKEKTVLSLSYGRIKVKATDKQHGLVPESYETYQVVNEGNIIIRGTDLQNDHTSLRIGLSRNRGIISSAYLCLEAQPSITPDYGYQILNVFDLTKAIYRYGSGLRQNLDHGEIKRLPIFLPPLDEQLAIVRFLDHANRKIDGFIRAKRKLIGLLNEQKQVIIQEAISKVSGPQSKSMPVRAVLRPVKRFGHPTKTLLSLFREYGVIPKDSRENKNADVRDLALCQLVKPGDVVMNKMKAWQGSIAVSELEGIVSPDYMVLEFRIDPVVGKFFHFALRSTAMVANYRKQAYGVRPGQWRLMYPDFCRLRLPVPSIEEQQAIVDHITRETESLEAAIARAEREIALMQEYRTRLTADIVTGKLDVREAAAQLPVAAEDSVNEPMVDEEENELETEEAG